MSAVAPDDAMRILAISGSTRAGSTNTALLRAMASRAPAGIHVELLLALAGCSDSNDDEDPAEDPVDGGTYLIGGGGCRSGGTSGVPVAVVDPDAGDGVGNEPVEVVEDPAPDEIDACADDPTELASTGLRPTGSGSLMFDGQEYALGSAIRVGSTGPDGFSVELLLHDGETRVSRTAATSDDGAESGSGYAYGVYDATVALTFTLVSDDAEGDLSGRLYEVVPGDDDVVDGTTPAGAAVAVDPSFVVDLDGDGTISAEELFEIASGQLVWSGTEEAPSLSFNLVLADGRPVEGSYEGEYELVE